MEHKRDVEELKKDDQFEDFLQSHSPSPAIERLARRRYYGSGAFGMLYPGDVNPPPPIPSNRPNGPSGPTGPTTLRYPIEDIEASGQIVRDFLRAHPDQDKRYRTYFLSPDLR